MSSTAPMEPAAGYRQLDAALDFLASYGPELANGFTSHAPMVVEALSALGRPEAVLPWLERAQPALRPRPTPRTRLEPGAWRTALGAGDCFAEWSALLRAELAGAPWRPFLRRWLLRLMPGFCADALHGPIRVAHAVRALDVEETAPRRRELADALAAWAAAYQTLPLPTERRRGALGPEEAVPALPLQPVAERSFRGSIVSSLEGLASFRAFAPVIDWIDPGELPAASVSALTRAFAGLYLAQVRDPLLAIVFVHGITSAAALRPLLPHLTPAEGRELLLYAWQAGAALHASFGSAAPAGAPGGTGDEDPDGLVERAIASGDDHAVKVTEACLGEHRRAPSPLYLAAARHAVETLSVP